MRKISLPDVVTESQHMICPVLLRRRGLLDFVPPLISGPQPFFISLIQKPMPPAQRGIAVHANLRRRRPNRSGLAQHDDVIEPLLAQPEPRQRRAGQVVECPVALATAKALAVIGLAVPVQLPATAMRAAALHRPAVCNEGRKPVKTPLRLRDRHCPHRPGIVEQHTMRN
jgi:hypothetical protein